LLGIGVALNVGIFLKYEALFLAIMLGIPIQSLTLVMTILLVFVLVYVLLGGMISIVLTDFVQFVFLSIGCLIVTILLLFKFNISEVIKTTIMNVPGGGLNPFNSPQMGWTFIIWQIVLQIAVWTTWQTTVMRMFSAKSPEVGKKIYFWTGVMMIGMFAIPVLWGIFARAALGNSVASSQAMPVMLSKILPTGFKGLIVAAMIAASMSSYSGYLLGWAAILSQDVIIPLRRKEMSSNSQIWLNRFFVLLLGLFILFYGLWYKLSESIFVYTSMTANLYLAGTFISIMSGIYWKKATTIGAYSSLIAGTVPIISFFFFNISAEIAGASSFIFAIAGMFLGSLFTAKSEIKNVKEVIL
ncbi:MAG: sodium:solute symporter family protein, partial [Ignavibacteriaceae bacterium]